MAADYTHNGYARAQRTVKATKLAVQLYAQLDRERRRELERLAGLDRAASDETWAEAAELLSRRLRWDYRHGGDVPAGSETDGQAQP